MPAGPRPARLYPKVVYFPPSLLRLGPPGLPPAQRARAAISLALARSKSAGFPDFEVPERFNLRLSEEELDFLAKCKARGKVADVIRRLLEDSHA